MMIPSIQPESKPYLSYFDSEFLANHIPSSFARSSIPLNIIKDVLSMTQQSCVQPPPRRSCSSIDSISDSTSTRSSFAEEQQVAEALEIAREVPEGSDDPHVANTLENALQQIWAKVEAHPDAYVMTHSEFAVFNFFQWRFQDNKLAKSARLRYWNNASGNEGKATKRMKGSKK